MALFGLSPLPSNCLFCLLSFFYAGTAVAVADALLHRHLLGKNASRKVVHLAAANWVLWFPLFDATHPSWVLNIAAPSAFSLRLLFLGFFGSPDDEDVRVMSRTGSPSELLYGPLYFTLAMCILGTWGFMDPRTVLIMGPLGWGDGLASVVGMKYGRHVHTLLGHPRSLEGSAAMLVFSILGSLLFRCALPHPSLTLERIIATSCAATAVEAASPREVDNLLIPLAVLLVDSFM
eukprot:GGOE01061342.1.p1 GENE.GGOE01061342.1~~GGOE01061342.1.p1  ORF type:complete len:234 (+),score=65.02 GGOE01061342.1:99-800(+)